MQRLLHLVAFCTSYALRVKRIPPKVEHGTFPNSAQLPVGHHLSAKVVRVHTIGAMHEHRAKCLLRDTFLWPGELDPPEAGISAVPSPSLAGATGADADNCTAVVLRVGARAGANEPAIEHITIVRQLLRQNMRTRNISWGRRHTS